MGRKKIALPSEDVQAVDALVIREELSLQEREKEIQRVEKLYGDGEPYDPALLITRGQFAAKTTAEAMEAIGKACLRIKAHEQHGFYTEAVKRMGITYDYAWFTMTAVEKFGNLVALQDLGNSKARAMLVFEKPIIQEYLQGGDLAGIPHDDVSKMTSRELDAEVRKLRKKLKDERKVQEDAISKKEEKLNELEQKLRYQEPPTKEQLAEVHLEPLKKKLFEHLLQAQFHLDEAVNVAAAAQKVEGATFPQLQEWAKTHYEQLAPIGELYEELDQALNNCGPDKPGNPYGGM
jgi:molybdenum-dependent DNA-binding transcriptional regulator ModE